LLADRLGGYGAGFLAALPLVGACTLWQVQRAGPRAALAGFLRGYAVGNASKTAFVLGMAGALPVWGAAFGTLAGAASAIGALVVIQVASRRATRTGRRGTSQAPANTAQVVAGKVAPMSAPGRVAAATRHMPSAQG